MIDSSGTPLLVELFLSNARVRGMTREVYDRHRLIDVLNTGDEMFRLDGATVVMASAPDGRDFGALNLEKHAILAAIPRETTLQLKERSMLTAVGGRSQTTPIKASLVVQQFVAEGTVHVPAGAGMPSEKLRADPALFSRFIPMTDARVRLPNGTAVEAHVLLVNRDFVAATSVATSRRGLADAVG